MAFSDRPKRLTALTTYLISQTARLAKVALDSRLLERGMRLRHMAVLAVLDEGPTSQLELGRRLTIDPSDVTATVDDLENAGLAQRQTDAGDRRRKIVTLTARGRRELDALDRIARDVEEGLLGPLSQRRRDALYKDLLRVLRADDERDAE